MSSENGKPVRVSRRQLLKGAVAVGALLSLGGVPACVAPPGAAPTAAPTTAPAVTQAPAADKAAEVLIGAPYATTGSMAQSHIQNVQAIYTAIELINNKHEVDLPLARTEGLPNLGGAKVKAAVPDTQGLPEKGKSEAERLITEQKVVALCGGQASSIAATISQAAEEAGIPYVGGEPSSPSLSTRGFKWFFRTGPTDITFTEAQMGFLKGLVDEKKLPIKTLALFHEDTLFGSDSAKVQTDLAPKYGFQVVENIAYRANTISMVTEVQKLKAANPDILMPTSYATDAILLTKTMKEQNWKPKMIVAQDAGHLDNVWIQQSGKDSQGVTSRSGFDYDLGTKRPSVTYVQDLYKKIAGYEMVESAAKTFVGFLVLCDAINRAASTKPEDIRKALLATDMKPEQTIMPWKGIKFNPDTGQNDLASGIIVQLQGDRYYSVWPFDTAAKELQYPAQLWG